MAPHEIFYKGENVKRTFSWARKKYTLFGRMAYIFYTLLFADEKNNKLSEADKGVIAKFLSESNIFHIKTKAIKMLNFATLF